MFFFLFLKATTKRAFVQRHARERELRSVASRATSEVATDAETPIEKCE